MDWYYELEGRQAGPVTENELGRLLREGAITVSTLVWHAGMQDWTPYSAAIGMPPVPPVSPLQATHYPRTQPSAGPGRFVYAGFWIRALAYIIDGIVIGALRAMIFFPLGFTVLDPHPFGFWFVTHLTEAKISSVVLTLCYFVFFWTYYGATPGKMVLKLKVVTPLGGLISLPQAVGRYFGQILSGIILCIGFMMAGWDDEKRALHDRLADTRVIRLNEIAPLF